MKTNSTLNNKEILSVLEQYNFYKGNPFKIFPISKSHLRTIVRVKSFELDLLVKKYNSSFPTKKFLLPHKIQLRLNQNKFPCPQIKKNHYGNTVTKFGGFYYVVQSWLKGKIINPDHIPTSNQMKFIKQIGKMFGLLHKIMSKMNIKPERKYHYKTAKLLFKNSNYRTRKISKFEIFKPLLHTRIKLRFRKSDFDRWVLSYLPKLGEYARELYNFPYYNYPSLEDLIPTHDDIHWNNILFENNNLVGLLDFDNADICPREWDIGQTVAMIFVCDCNIDHIQKFLQIYYEFSGYKPDVSILPTIMQLKYLRTLLWTISQHYSKNKTRHENFQRISYHIADCHKWLLNNKKILSKLNIE